MHPPALPHFSVVSHSATYNFVVPFSFLFQQDFLTLFHFTGILTKNADVKHFLFLFRCVH